MVGELRWKSVVAGGVLQRSEPAGAAGQAEKRFDPRLSTAFAERRGRESPGELESSTGFSAPKSKEATA